jgi:mono/diheme cytochrome c family protein
MKPMTHSPHRRTRLKVVACKRAGVLAFALFATLSNGVAAPADPVNGERLAKQWCAACHIVSADQTRGADNVPAFSAIAKMRGFSAENIGQFLLDPHPKMPDMQLTRDEARDLGAYIASLAH